MDKKCEIKKKEKTQLKRDARTKVVISIIRIVVVQVDLAIMRIPVEIEHAAAKICPEFLRGHRESITGFPVFYLEGRPSPNPEHVVSFPSC